MIIKAQHIHGPGKPVIKKAVHLAQRQAEQIVSDAQFDAERLLAEARRQQKVMMETARHEGYAAGLSEWNETLIKALKSRDDLFAQSEQELLRLAIRIAQKIIGQELKTDANAIAAIVREAVKSCRRARNLVIQVNPEHELHVRERVSSFQLLLGNMAQITVIADSALTPGDCIVESDIGIIDARLETQLKSLEQALLRRVKA
jgi:type III secretion protein L